MLYNKFTGKRTGFLAVFLLLVHFLYAQVPADTTVYEVADMMPSPIIPACSADRHLGWNADSVRRCSEGKLYSILSANIRYPETARTQNLQGAVVVSFVVETNGRITGLKLLRDVGGGCGEEAMRVLKAVDEAGLRWNPAQIRGQPVRMRQSLPLRFRLTEALPYYIAETGDSIYTTVDTDVSFRGGVDSLLSYVINRLDYPAAYKDSCKAGVVEMNVILRGDRSLSVVNSLDFSNMGMDFQWEATRMVKRSAALWTPARYQDKPVTTSFPLRAVFKSNAAGCKATNELFDRALLLSDEATRLVQEKKNEEAIAKWSEAVRLQPFNTELLYYRGTALINNGRREEGCEDYTKIHALLGVTWFEPIRKIMCP